MDALELSMNRAAEKASAEAKAVGLRTAAIGRRENRRLWRG